MKKLTFGIIFIFTILFPVISQDIKIQIVEVKGLVDVKIRDGQWEPLTFDTAVIEGMEIFTGFHGQVTLQIGKESFVTINQLTHVTFDKLLLMDEAKASFTLVRGYLVLYAKSTEDEKNKIFVKINNGTMELENAGGEVYYREDKGTIVKSFIGRIDIGSKLSKMYFIKKGEVCGIMPGGRLIESDMFIREDMNAKSNNLNQEHEILVYYNLISIPYTSELYINDYYNYFKP